MWTAVANLKGDTGEPGELRSVRVATTANITLSGTQTIDGVSLSVDDLVLVKNQSTPSENGIYAVKSDAWVEQVWSTASVIVAVDEGPVNGGNIYTNLVSTTPLERDINASQVQGLLDAGNIPDLDAAKIVSGQLSSTVLPRRRVFAASSGTFAANTACGRHSPMTCTVSQATAGGASLATNAIWYPFFIPHTTQVTLSLNCTTLQASSFIRLSIFSANESTVAPSSLLEDVGTVSGASTGLKQITTAGTFSGFVFVGAWMSNHSTMRWTRLSPDTSGSNPMGGPGGTNTRVPVGWFATGLDYSASWPAGSPPALTLANGTDQVQYPAIWMEWT